MKIEKLAELKNYSNRQLLHHLINIRNNLQDDFLITEPLNTKKTLTDKINRTCNCYTKSLKSEEVDTDNGDMVNFTLYENSCNNYMICSMCSKERATRLWNKYGDEIEAMALKYPDYIYMLNFTIEDESRLNEMYLRFSKSIEDWRKMGQKRVNGRSPGESSKVKAAIMGLETKIGKNSGKNHLHGHMLAFCDSPLDYTIYTDIEKKQALIDKYGYGNVPENELRKCAEKFVTYEGKEIPVSKLSLEWFKATRGKGVNIKAIPIKKNVPIKNQCREIIKYPVKVSELTEDFVKDVLCYKEGKRFFRAYGEFIHRDFTKVSPEEEKEETVKDERPLKLYDITTLIYDREKEEYTTGTDEDEILARELYKRKDKIIEFMAKCTLARNHKTSMFMPIKVGFALSIEEYSKEKRLETIKVVDAIYIAYKYYLKYLYDKILKMPHIKTYKKKLRTMNELEKYYYKTFLALKLVPDESKQ